MESTAIVMKEYLKRTILDNIRFIQSGNIEEAMRALHKSSLSYSQAEKMMEQFELPRLY